MKLIVLADAAWGIGLGGDQLLYLPEDLKRFQRLTTGHTILVGRKTLATFPGGRPLKNRRNMVLSTSAEVAPEGAEVFSDVSGVVAAAPPDTFVVGGEQVYRQLEPYCDVALVTRLEEQFPADRYFPNLDRDPAWRETEREGPFAQEGHRYWYVTYCRVKDAESR